MKKTVPLSIPNKKINYSPQYRNMVDGENIVFGQEENRVETINTDVIELHKVKTPEVSMKDYVITATCATEGANIYYTDDGSVPTVFSKLYQGPINVDHDATYSFVAVKNGMIDSDEAEMKVEIVIEEPEMYLDYRTGLITIVNPNGAGKVYYTQKFGNYSLKDPITEGNEYVGPIDATGSNGNFFVFAVLIGSNKSNYVYKYYPGVSGGYSASWNIDWFYCRYYINWNVLDYIKVTYTEDGSTPYFDGQEITNVKRTFIPIYGYTTIKTSTFEENYIPQFGFTFKEFGYSDKPTAPEIIVDNYYCEIKRAGETENIIYWPYPDERGCYIIYTTDGSDPSKDNGKIYDNYDHPGEMGPFQVEPGTTVKAITICCNKYISDISTYTVD